MRQPNVARVVAVAAVVAGSAIAATIGSSAQASAATVAFPDVPTLANGGVCWTTINSWADTSPATPGRAILNVRAAPVSGVGSGQYPFAPLCEVRTTVAWHNLDTGAAGRFDNIVATGIYGSIQYSLFQDTGPGRVEVTVSTDTANIPAHATFDVPG
ncbi:hypothetical protein [Nocardia callitridis]|uniref:Secreted protein n=1 Tax=Nocardia callitridis TaxID=648753 RepID=A0ABP9JU89_9NOCA